MNEKEISNLLFDNLQHLGCIKWHKNQNHSFYLKFKDVRLGSIRISNHKGRDRYSYTYSLYKNEGNLGEKIKHVIESIEAKSKTIYNFDPEKFIVFDVEKRQYVEVANYGAYKDYIWKKKQKN